MNNVTDIAELSRLSLQQLTPLIGPANARKLFSFFKQTLWGQRQRGGGGGEREGGEQRRVSKIDKLLKYEQLGTPPLGRSVGLLGSIIRQPPR
jgi:hypothetical protein